MKKKITISFLILLLFIPNVVLAKTYSYWYSNGNKIGFTSNRGIWSNNLSGGFTDTNFNSYYNHATSEWRGAGISTYGVDSKSDAILHWYAGTRDDLEELEPDLYYYAALTVVSSSLYNTGSYNSKTIYNYKLNSAKIYTPQKLFGTHGTYKVMFTHELGHALGYYDHSTNSSDVMDASANNDTLTSRDINHLSQNY